MSKLPFCQAIQTLCNNHLNGLSERAQLFLRTWKLYSAGFCPGFEDVTKESFKRKIQEYCRTRNEPLSKADNKVLGQNINEMFKATKYTDSFKKPLSKKQIRTFSQIDWSKAPGFLVKKAKSTLKKKLKHSRRR